MRLIVISLVIASAILFIAANAIGRLGAEIVNVGAGSDFPCTVVGTQDGDGPVVCGEYDPDGRQVLVRLRGIEARDFDETCRLASGCPEMNGAEATRVLLLIIGDSRLQCRSYGVLNNRVDAFCSKPDGTDVNCEMVRRSAAVRWPEFDREGRLLACAPGPRG